MLRGTVLASLTPSLPKETYAQKRRRCCMTLSSMDSASLEALDKTVIERMRAKGECTQLVEACIAYKARSVPPPSADASVPIRQPPGC